MSDADSSVSSSSSGVISEEEETDEDNAAVQCRCIVNARCANRFGLLLVTNASLNVKEPAASSSSSRGVCEDLDCSSRRHMTTMMVGSGFLCVLWC